jgi:hypothetical protein
VAALGVEHDLVAALAGGQVGEPLDADRLAGPRGADQEGGQPQLPWWRDDQAAVLPAGQIPAERRAEGVGVQPAGLTVGQALGPAPGPPLGPLAPAPLRLLELGRDDGGVPVGGAVAGGRGQSGRDGQGQLGKEDRPERGSWMLRAPNCRTSRA